MSEQYFSARLPAKDSELFTLPIRLAEQTWPLQSAPGVFSFQHLDKATQILLKQVPPPPPEGRFLDLGCGWGPIALTMALKSPQAQVWATDISQRALDLCARNSQICGVQLKLGVPEMVLDQVKAAGGLDLIWSNPPVRIGKTALRTLLLTWISLLTPGGKAYLVIGKNLGADGYQKWLTEAGYGTSRISSKQGFRVLEVEAKTT